MKVDLFSVSLNHGDLMKYYSRRSDGGKMSKVLFRIFFVICAALVIVILSAMLGNYLKNKVAATDESMKSSDESTDIQLSNNTSELYDNTSVSDFSIKACGIDITAYTDDGDMLNAIDILASYYNTIIIPLCSDDGSLIYSSPSLAKIARQEISEENAVYDTLVSCINKSNQVNLDVCALITPSSNSNITSPSNAAFIDSTVISELTNLGVNRVIIKLPSASDDSYTKWIRSYISEIEFEENKIGIAFSPDYLLDAKGIRQLQLFSSMGAFTCIYFEGYSGNYDTIYDNVTHTLNSMLGIFDLYTVTALIGQSDNITAVYNACKDAEIGSISFTEYTLPSDLVKKLTDTDESVSDSSVEETETEQQIITNPYAGSSLSNDSNTESENETEEYYDDYYYDSNDSYNDSEYYDSYDNSEDYNNYDENSWY